MAGIFKAYDIRGIVGSALTPQKAYLIGRGLAKEIFDGQGPIVVTRDMRTHSPELAGQLVRGLSEGGCDVIDAGLAATPMNYWANAQFNAYGSVTVTASHNGPEYNGFKVSGKGAIPLDHASGLDKVEAFVVAAEGGDALPEVTKTGTVTVQEDILTPYIEFMSKFVADGSTTLKIGIDTANGMGGFFLPAFLEKIPFIQAEKLYFELDGSFPNHEADPLKPENLEDVSRLVREKGLDFGVAYDGDADRCMFVDDTGAPVSSDLITALIAGAVLEKEPGAAILFDLRSSKIAPEWIEQHGGRPVRGRVGHSFMKRLLAANNAPFGGELSGHYYFRDCFNTDSGLMAMIQVINIWLEAQKSGPTPLSQLVAPLRKYSATGEINFKVADVATVQKSIEEHYAALGAKTDHLDGLTVDLGEWWFNLRSSNTEPLLRLNLEAANDAERDKHYEEVKTLIGGEIKTGH